MTVTNAFLKSIPITAGVIGDKLGVRVEVGGRSAYTDGDTITIPEPSDKIGTDETLGFVLHECGHVKYSSIKTKPDDMNLLKFKIYNGFEDPRIEYRLAQDYPGVPYLIGRTMKALMPQMVETLEKGRVQPAKLITFYCKVAANRVFGFDSLSEIENDIRALTTASFGTEIVDLIDETAGKIPDCANSEDVMVHASAVFEKLREMAADQKSDASEDQQNSSGGGLDLSDPKDQSQSSPSEGSGAASEQPDGGSSEGAESEKDEAEAGNAGSADEASSDDEGMGKAKPQGAGDSSDYKGEKERSRGARKSAAEKAEEKKAKAKERAEKAHKRNLQQALNSKKTFEDPLDISESMKKALEENAPLNAGFPRSSDASDSLSLEGTRSEIVSNPAKGQARLTAARAESAQMRRYLKGLLEADQRRKVELRDSGTRVAGKRLASLVTGNTRIFRHCSEGRGVNTALHILLDLSGSMGSWLSNRCGSRTREEEAINASLALLTALDGMKNVSTGFTVLPGMAADASYRVRSRSCVTILEHGRRITTETAGLIGGLTSDGGTPMEEALLTVAKQLAVLTREKRHIVIVITDGMVGDDTQNLVRTMSEGGIEMIGIGIAADVSHVFDRSARIESAGELGRALFSLAKESLLRHTNR